MNKLFTAIGLTVTLGLTLSACGGAVVTPEPTTTTTMPVTKPVETTKPVQSEAPVVKEEPKPEPTQTVVAEPKKETTPVESKKPEPTETKKPVVKPAPAPKPTTSKPAPKPAVSKPAPKPTTAKPAPKPTVAKPAPKPTVSKPAPKPKPTVKPAPKPKPAAPAPKPKPSPKPSPKPVAPKPAPKPTNPLEELMKKGSKVSTAAGQSEVIGYINAERAKKGLNSLKRDAVLDKVAAQTGSTSTQEWADVTIGYIPTLSNPNSGYWYGIAIESKMTGEFLNKATHVGISVKNGSLYFATGTKL